MGVPQSHGFQMFQILKWIISNGLILDELGYPCSGNPPFCDMFDTSGEWLVP